MREPFAALKMQRTMGHADLDELAGYVQETPRARAAAPGELPPLAAVEDVGPRGTNLDDQTFPKTPKGDEKHRLTCDNNPRKPLRLPQVPLLVSRDQRRSGSTAYWRM